MYANAIECSSLPLVLDRDVDGGPHRRHGIAGHCFDPSRMDRFNRLLAQFGRPAPVHPDQLATAARSLPAAGGGLAACIAQRLDRAASMSRMLADRGWQPANGAEPVALAVVEYVRERDDVIPDWIPGAGRLDDAIVVEQAWPMVSAEVIDYLDFCRLRELEAALGGTDATALRFTRADWLESRRAEAALKSQRREAIGRSYVPSGSTYFRVH